MRRELLVAPPPQALRRREVVVVPVRVVDVAVLDRPHVQRVLRHRDLRAVEDRRLVHVVPDVQVRRGARVLRGGEVAGPPRADLGVHDVEVR